MPYGYETSNGTIFRDKDATTVAAATGQAALITASGQSRWFYGSDTVVEAMFSEPFGKYIHKVELSGSSQAGSTSFFTQYKGIEILDTVDISAFAGTFARAQALDVTKYYDGGVDDDRTDPGYRFGIGWDGAWKSGEDLMIVHPDIVDWLTNETVFDADVHELAKKQCFYLQSIMHRRNATHPYTKPVENADGTPEWAAYAASLAVKWATAEIDDHLVAPEIVVQAVIANAVAADIASPHIWGVVGTTAFPRTEMAARISAFESNFTSGFLTLP